MSLVSACDVTVDGGGDLPAARPRPDEANDSKLLPLSFEFFFRLELVRNEALIIRMHGIPGINGGKCTDVWPCESMLDTGGVSNTLALRCL